AGGMNLVAASTNQPTWYSADGGAHWSKATMPAGTSITALWGSSVANLWGVGLSGTVVFSSDGGKSWTARDAGTTEHMQAVIGRGPNDVFVAAWNQVLRTQDGGQTWQSL